MAEWIECTEPIAYGVLNLTPTAYENLQAGEFQKMVDGYQMREKASDQKRAYFLSWLVSMQSTRPVSAAKILAPLYPDDEQQEHDQRQADEEYLRQEFGLA